MNTAAIRPHRYLARNCPVGLSPPVDFSDRGAQVTHAHFDHTFICCAKIQIKLFGSFYIISSTLSTISDT
jgi:hypothetical protein